MANLKAIDFGDSSSRGYFYDDTITTDILDTKQGTISVWCKRDNAGFGNVTNLVILLNASDKGITFGFDSSTRFTFLQNFTSPLGGSYQLRLINNDVWETSTEPDNWVHVVISWDRATDTFLYRINGSTLGTTGGTPTWTRTYGNGADSSTPDITNHNHIVINAENSSQTYGQSSSGFSQILFDNKFYDLTDSAVLSKFYNSGAVEMGTSGTSSGLTAPLLYFYGDTAATFRVNNGDTASTHRITNYSPTTQQLGSITTVTGPSQPAIQHNASAALSSAATVSATGLLVQVDEYVHVGYWAAEYTEEIANRFGSAALTSTVTQTVIGGLRKDGASALSVTATQAAIGGLRKDGASALTTSASLTAVGGLRKDGASALSVTATQAVSGELRKDGASALSVTATQAASGAVLKNGQSALSVTATQATSSAVLKNGQSALAVTATLSATAQTSDEASAAMSVTATISASAINIKNGVATLSSTATLSVSGQDFDIATANLASAFTLTATSQKIIIGSAAMQSTFVMTTVAELLQQSNVERTIAVKSETRIVKALQDQRIIPVNSESRINIVLADSRTILVPDETRILKEP
jgi:hypothetical protein